MLRTPLTLIWLIWQWHVSAQSPHFFRHFTEKDGLSSDYVTCILREPQGYLWVGTNYGLNRYDGRQFKTYLPGGGKPEETVCNEYINALALDDSGLLWIGTRKGLSSYDPRLRRFKTWLSSGNNDHSLPGEVVNYLLADGQRLWVACDNRDLAYLDLNTGLFKRFPWKKFTENLLPVGDGKDYRTIYSIQKKSDHSLWLHTNLGLMIFDVRSGQFENCSEAGRAMAPFQAEDLRCPEHVLMGSWDNDVLCYNPCRKRWSQLPLPVSHRLRDGFRRVSQVAQDGLRYWILSQQGLYFFESTKGKIGQISAEKGNTNHVPEGAMQVYYRDFQGLRWFGGERGLWLLDPHLQHFQYIPLDTTHYASYANRYARILEVPALQRMLISDLYRGQLLVLEKGKWIKTIQLGGPCHILQQDSQGRIWVSGGIHLYQLDPKTLQRTRLPIPLDLFGANKSTFLSDFEVDWNGNYWVAGNNCGLLIYQSEKKSWEKPGPAQNFTARKVLCLYADEPHRSVWVGSEEDGLYRYEPHTKQFIHFRPNHTQPERSVGAYMIRDIGATQQDHIWMAGDPGGLTRFTYHPASLQAFTTYNTTMGLPSNQVCSVLRDQAGRLWAGTTKGLLHLDERTGAPIYWNKNSGLQNQYLDLPLSLGADGTIYMGGTQGVAYFHPDSLLSSLREPGVLLNSFKVFDREMAGSFQREITLPWQDNFFSVEFATGNFSMPERTSYTAQLQGFEDAAQPLGAQPYRAFTNVPPGQYTLLLTANREQSGSSFLSLKVTILPPFWQTWWFRLSTLALIGCLIGGIYHYRIRQIRQQEALKTAFNRRLAQVEMSALRAQMNPHFVFNCLNSINRFILVNEPEAASGYLTKFSRLIRLILDNSRNETISLDKELDAMRLYIEMEAMRFEGRFDYAIEIDPQLQPEHIEVPPLLIQPFVENAIWHGLMHQKERGALLIRIAPMPTAQISGNQPHPTLPGNHWESGLHIMVEDNGVGRTRAQTLKSKSTQTHPSQGIHLTSERLEMIRVLYGVHTEIQITDLFTPKGTPAGTRVNIYIT